MSTSSTTELDGDGSDTGDGRVDPDADDLLDELDAIRERSGTVTVSCEYKCHSGETFGGRWRGVAVADLLTTADPETTHVRAVSTDGYCVPVPVAVALETVLALERLDGSLESADRNDHGTDGLPRLVGEEIEGSWTVRDVVRLEAVSLPANADAEPCYVDDLADVLEDAVDDDDRTEVVG